MKLLKHGFMWSLLIAGVYSLLRFLPFFSDRLIFGAVFLIAWILLYVGIFFETPFIKLGKLKWELKHLAHVLILGQTRRGKSSSGFSQLMYQMSRFDKRWGGLVLGVKNTEHVFYEDLFRTMKRLDDVKVLMVRPSNESESWEPPETINLTGDRRIPWSSYAAMIVDTGKALSGDDSNPFWGNVAEKSFADTFELLERLGEPTTIPNLYKVLMNRDILEEKLKVLARQIDLDEVGERIIRDLDAMFLSAKAQEQLEATTGTLRQYLAFFLDPDIQKTFCSENPTLRISDVDFGKVICSSIPQRYQRERKFIHTLLKSLAYTHIMMRFDLEAQNPKAFKKLNHLYFAFDEAQDVITASEKGMSDHTIADRIGGAKAHLIFGMQSANSPESKISKEKNKNLINHFSTRIIFQLSDEKEAEEAASYLGKEKKVKVRRSYKTFQAFSEGKNVEKEWEWRVPPIVFLSLDVHQAVVIHPNKDFDIVEIPPIGADGKVQSWYKPIGLKKIKKLTKR